MTVNYEPADVPPDSDDVADGIVVDGKPCSSCATFVPLSKGGRQFDKCLACRRDARLNGGSTTSTVKAPAGRSANWEAPLQRGLADMGQGFGMLVTMANQVDGQAIMAGSPRLAESLIAPARANPKVRHRLESIVEGGAWGAVAMAVLAIAMPILANHNMLPGQRPAKPTAPRTTPDPTNVGHVNV